MNQKELEDVYIGAFGTGQNMKWECEKCEITRQSASKFSSIGIQLKRAVMHLNAWIPNILENTPSTCPSCLSFVCADCIMKSLSEQENMHIYLECPLCDDRVSTGSIYRLPDAPTTELVIDYMLHDYNYIGQLKKNRLLAAIIKEQIGDRIEILRTYIEEEPQTLKNYFLNSLKLMQGRSLLSLAKQQQSITPRMNSPRECPVCLSTKELEPLICSHYFCVDCIVKWFQHHNTCPTCRFNFLTLEL